MLSRAINRLWVPSIKLLSRNRYRSFSWGGEGKEQKNSSKQIISLESCEKMKQVLLYLTNYNKNFGEADLRDFCDRIYVLRATQLPWLNYYPITSKIRELDFSKCSLSTFARLIAITPIIDHFDLFSEKTYGQMFEKMERSIEQLQLLSIDEVIMLMEAKVKNRLFIIKLQQIFLAKLNDLKIVEKVRYLEVINRNRFPHRKSRAVFSQFIRREKEKFDKMSIKLLITYYRCLKNLNPYIYPFENIVQLLEDKIKRAEKDLQQREIHYLLQFKTLNNAFKKLIYTKLLSTIDDKGFSSISPANVLRILYKLVDLQTFKLQNEEKEEKMMKFILRHLKQMGFILQLIRKKFFNRTHLKTINQHVENYNIVQVQNNVQYNFQLLSRNIFPKYLQNVFLQQMKKHKSEPEFNVSFFSCAIIAWKLAKANPKYVELKKILAHFENLIGFFRESSGKIKNLMFMGNKKAIVEFHKLFGHLFIPHISEKIIKEKEYPKINLLYYLLLAKDYKLLYRLVLISESKIEFHNIKRILMKFSTFPSYMIGSFGLVMRLCMDFKQVEYKWIMKWLSNFEMHALLWADQITIFLRLSRKMMKEFYGSLSYLVDFVSYLIKSPYRHIRRNQQYLNLLKEGQHKLLAAGEQNEVELKKQHFRIEMLVFFGEYLMRYNLLKKQYAENLSKKCLLEDGSLLKRYTELLINGEQLNWTEMQINPEYLVLVSKFLDGGDQLIKKVAHQVKYAVGKCSIKQLEDSLLNFEIHQNTKKLSILNIILDQFTKQMPYGEHNMVLSFSYLQKFQLISQQYDAFLKKILENTVRHFSSYAYADLPPLMNQCLRRQIPCHELMKIVVENFAQRQAEGLIDIYTHIDIFEAMVFIDSNLSHKVFQFIMRSHPKARQFARLCEVFKLIDLSKEVYLSETISLLKRTKHCISQSIYRYITEKSPKIKELKVEIKIEERNDVSWVRMELCSLMERHRIQFKSECRYGEYLIQIGRKKVGVVHRSGNRQVQKKMKEFFISIFEIPAAEQQNLIILLINPKMGIKAVLKILKAQFEELKVIGQEIPEKDSWVGREEEKDDNQIQQDGEGVIYDGRNEGKEKEKEKDQE